MPQLPDHLCGPGDEGTQILRTLQSRCCNHQPSGRCSQHGAIARLKKGETIDKLLYGNYSTISLGYAGLYECVKYMTGKSHTDDEAKPFALAVLQKAFSAKRPLSFMSIDCGISST